MEMTRRDMFQTSGKLLLLASAGASLAQITGAEEAPDTYKMADHWWGMIIDIDKRIGCHSFRATGITFFRMNGGSFEDASRLANHANLNTTKIYDRTFDEALVRGVERVDIPGINA